MACKGWGECNDAEVLGPLVNPRWLNALAGAVAGVLLALSMLLTLKTLTPRMPVTPTLTVLGVATAAVLGGGIFGSLGNRADRTRTGTADPRTWTMPPIEALRPPQRSAPRTLGLIVLRCYLFAAVAVLAVRAVQLALGSG